tara:strand:+ start:1024 stop:1671 length:648 start_codon:yes stop_codon:yes gene_type:complete
LNDSLKKTLGKKELKMSPFLMETFLILFVILDPLGLVPVFAALTKNMTEDQKRWIAFKSILISGSLLLIFALLGDLFLDTLSISEASFKIAGGIILFLVALRMVMNPNLGFDAKETLKGEDIAVFPLAIPLIAGPGGLISVMILMRQNETHMHSQVAIVATLVFVLLIAYLCMMFAPALKKVMGVTGISVTGRVFGIVLAGLAIEFMVTAFKTLF